MKRIITIILSAVLTMAVSAQERTPIDNIFAEISNITGRHFGIGTKINRGNGKITYHLQDKIARIPICTKSCGENVYAPTYENKMFSYILLLNTVGGKVFSSYANMTPEEIENANETNSKVYDRIFATIRHKLDSLMKLSEEGYHHESHSHGKDTIKYSICFKKRSNPEKEIKMGKYTIVQDNDDDETVSFDYTAKPKPCGKHVIGSGDLIYTKHIVIPNIKNAPFDMQSYLEKITPVLKRKDIKSWDFKWMYSDDYDPDVNYKDMETRNINGKTSILYPDGTMVEIKDAHVTGTIYFIPIEKKELADNIFTSIDSITQNYTDNHPEQRYIYKYNVKELVMQDADSDWGNIISLLEAGTRKIHFGVTTKGYYIVISNNNDKNFFIPKQWYCLKSFNNGKKEYIKGAKK